MPDPDRKTVSATESPALFDASPYITRWMLYRRFKHGDVVEAEPNERMYWGKELQPLILKKAAADLKLEVQPNVNDTYQRHNKFVVGCTRDALIYDPVRGWGSLETKCVFDYGVWFRDWQSGAIIPRHHEIQLQHQMFVGDGNDAHTWGVLAAWVCGEMKYYERKPIPEFIDNLKAEVGGFLAEVQLNREPDPFGSPIEYPLLVKLFDPEPGAILELPDDYRLAEIARLYKDFSETNKFYEKGAAAARLELIKVAKNDYEALHLPGDIWVHLRKSKAGALRVRVDIPDKLPDEIIADHPDAGVGERS
jgi:hypothetical protein